MRSYPHWIAAKCSKECPCRSMSSLKIFRECKTSRWCKISRTCRSSSGVGVYWQHEISLQMTESLFTIIMSTVSLRKLCYMHIWNDWHNEYNDITHLPMKTRSFLFIQLVIAFSTLSSLPTNTIYCQLLHQACLSTPIRLETEVHAFDKQQLQHISHCSEEDTAIVTALKLSYKRLDSAAAHDYLNCILTGCWAPCTSLAY